MANFRDLSLFCELHMGSRTALAVFMHSEISQRHWDVFEAIIPRIAGA